jgi:hypothetical protein
MSKHELTRPYEPNPALRALYRRFFEKIQVDEAWVRSVKDLASEGSIVYVLRNLNFIDFLALDYLTKRHRLPQIRFVNDLGLWILNPMGKGWLNAIMPPHIIRSATKKPRKSPPGDPAGPLRYYPRFGFSADAARGVASPFSGLPAFRALAQTPGALDAPTVIT